MATITHCAYCFDALIESLDSKPISPSITVSDSIKYPLFITWKKKSSINSSDWRLRGCIGTFSPRELSKGLKEYALISALKDHRFSAIKKSELSLLRCDVSLLIHFEIINNWKDWDIGIHGLQIEFSSSSNNNSSNNNSSSSKNTDNNKYSATFLPDVAKEQRWNKEDTFIALIEKAGYDGDAKKLFDKLINNNNNNKSGSIKITRYQSSKASLMYDDYVTMRNNRSFMVDAVPTNNKIFSSSSSSSSSASSSAMHLVSNNNNNNNNRNQSSSVGSKRRVDDDDD